MNRLMKLLLIGLAGLIAGCAATSAPDQAMVKSQVQAVLKENPDLVIEALRERKAEVYEIAQQGLTAKREAERNERLQAELQNPLSPAIDPARPILGNADAPVTIVEFSDFLCPYCAKGAATMRQLMELHPGKIRLLFKHLPLHDSSTTAALFFEALGRQSTDLAWRFHDEAFARQAEIEEEGEAVLAAIVEKLGADMPRFAQDLKDPALADRISHDIQEAHNFGFKGTPMYVINGVTVRGAQPYEEFDRVYGLVAKEK